jgi:predicted ester cyclase
MTTSTIDLSKLGYLFAEIMSSHDVSRLDEIKAPNYVNHNAFAEPGLEGSKNVLGAIIAGVPDLKVTAEDVIVSADGSRVVGRYRYEGTHTGNMLGYSGTGKPFVMRSMTSGGSRTDTSSSIGTSSTPSRSSCKSARCHLLANPHKLATPLATDPA